MDLAPELTIAALSKARNPTKVRPWHGAINEPSSPKKHYFLL